ncbi:MAG: hypothetical protein SGILL_002717 [Bacillariaceae sp.]
MRGSCRLLPETTAFICVAELTFHDTNSTVTVAGLSPNSLETGSLGITGGTGCYEGASGSVTLTAQSVVEEYDSYRWELIPSPNAEELLTCKSLHDRFIDGPLFDDNVNAENIGGYENAGSADLWYDNSVNIGSISGTEVAKSSGVCTLLPEAIEFECVGAIQFLDTGDYLFYAGISPNSFLPGEVLVTGGTGCYEGIRGKLALTALDISQPFDFFQWNLVPENTTDIDCMTLEEVIGTGLQESVVNQEIIGAANASGDLDLWDQNPLFSLGADGRQVGYSSGQCTLLPTAASWLCTGQLFFESLGSISVDGSGPNEKGVAGKLAVTGGSGCFANVTNTIYMTALQNGNFFWQLDNGATLPPNSSSSYWKLSTTTTLVAVVGFALNVV